MKISEAAMNAIANAYKQPGQGSVKSRDETYKAVNEPILFIDGKPVSRNCVDHPICGCAYPDCRVNGCSSYRRDVAKAAGDPDKIEEINWFAMASRADLFDSFNGKPSRFDNKSIFGGPRIKDYIKARADAGYPIKRSHFKSEEQ